MSKKVFVLKRSGYGTQEIKIEEVDLISQAPKSIVVQSWRSKGVRIMNLPNMVGSISTLPFAYSFSRQGAEDLRIKHVDNEIEICMASVALAQAELDKWRAYRESLDEAERG